jgi:hypothetical protein
MELNMTTTYPMPNISRFITQQEQNEDSKIANMDIDIQKAVDDAKLKKNKGEQDVEKMKELG